MLNDIKTITINQNNFVRSFKGKKCQFKLTDNYDDTFQYHLDGRQLYNSNWVTIGFSEQSVYSIEGNFYSGDKLVLVVGGTFKVYTNNPNQIEDDEYLTVLAYADAVNILGGVNNLLIYLSPLEMEVA